MCQIHFCLILREKYRLKTRPCVCACVCETALSTLVKIVFINIFHTVIFILGSLWLEGLAGVLLCPDMKSIFGTGELVHSITLQVENAHSPTRTLPYLCLDLQHTWLLHTSDGDARPWEVQR